MKATGVPVAVTAFAVTTLLSTVIGTALGETSERYPIFGAETEVVTEPLPGFDVTVFHLMDPIPGAEAVLVREDDCTNRQATGY